MKWYLKKRFTSQKGVKVSNNLQITSQLKKKKKQLKNQINCFQASYTSTVVFKEN